MGTGAASPILLPTPQPADVRQGATERRNALSAERVRRMQHSSVKLRASRTPFEQDLSLRQIIDSRLSEARLANAAGDDTERARALAEIDGLIKEGNGDD